ncbi:MAG: hypothetical protein KME16_00265 [Scytolyngbya sp. HA4215-MV1]|nr:hypothetical protein [Scytolyngbya sp. HA4215-MV1]
MIAFANQGIELLEYSLTCGDAAMVIEAGKRLKTVIVKKESIEYASTFLQQLPEKPKENLSLREAINQLRDQLKAALIKGYSYEDLAKMLTGKGIEISPSTLKNYVPSGKRQAAKEQAAAVPTKSRRTKKTEGDTSASGQADLDLGTPIAEIDIAAPTPAVDTAEPAEPEPPKPARGRGKAATASNSAAKTKAESNAKAAPEAAPVTRQTRSRRSSVSKPAAKTNARSTATRTRKKTS